MALDDELSPMELSDDPRIPELQAKLAGIEVGMPESCAGQLAAILSDASILGADLCKAGLSGTDVYKRQSHIHAGTFTFPERI